MTDANNDKSFNFPDNTKKLYNLKAVLDKAKEAKTKAEATLEQLQVREKELVEQMAQMGVTPETITEEISNLEKAIAENFAKAEALIPEEYISMMR